MAASEFSRTFARKHLHTELTVGARRLMSSLDESLQEVRDVIAELVAQAETEHVVSERTRRLIQQLQVKE
jgi:hypothetical protein